MNLILPLIIVVLCVLAARCNTKYLVLKSELEASKNNNIKLTESYSKTVDILKKTIELKDQEILGLTIKEPTKEYFYDDSLGNSVEIISEERINHLDN